MRYTEHIKLLLILTEKKIGDFQFGLKWNNRDQIYPPALDK